MISQLQFISQQTEQFSHLESIASACEAGVKWVQLRIKDETAQNIYPIAVQAKELCSRYGARLIINDHPSLAATVGAYGVHLGKEDLPVAEARKIVGKTGIIGATANTFEDIKKHVEDGADYVGVGPFQFTTTKKKLSPVLGVQGYTHIMQQCRACNISIPVIAIGGIELPHITGIMETGVQGIAVSSLIACAADKKQVIDQIFHLIKSFSTTYAHHSQ